MASSNHHEDFGRNAPPPLPPTRDFAFVMAAVFIGIGLYFWWKSDISPWWSFGLAGVFLVLELVFARALVPLNRLWFALGRLLGKIVSPVVMGLIFFLVVTPIGLFRRLIGKKSFDTRFDRQAKSYWRIREANQPDPDHLDRQF